MLQLPIDLAAETAAHLGIVTAAEIRRSGVSRSALERFTASGALVPIHAGVYRVATSPDTFSARCAAACLGDREAVVTGLAGGRLWWFRHIPRVHEPEVLVAHDRRPLTRGVVVRRTNVLDDTDIVHRDDGIRVANPSRVWFDCASAVDDERFERLTEWVIDKHATVPTLWRAAARLSKRGRPGSARVRRVMSLRSDWQQPANSGLELRVFKALVARGIGPLVRQHPLKLYNGIVIHPDVAVPQLRWAVEVDHVTWHGGRFDAQADKGRDRQARRIGWQVDRVTDLELTTAFKRTIDELVDLFWLRTAELAA